MKTFDFAISKKFTFFVFKHDLTRLFKDDPLSPSNRFLDFNSSINPGDSWGSRENVSSHQMFKISYILKIGNFKINLKKSKIFTINYLILMFNLIFENF